MLVLLIDEPTRKYKHIKKLDLYKPSNSWKKQPEKSENHTILDQVPSRVLFLYLDAHHYRALRGILALL